MNANNMHSAKQLLVRNGYTCVLCGEGRILTATARGVRPLAQWLRDGEDLRGYSAADKVVGRATAFLYCLLGVREVYAHVMSQQALSVLLENHIHAEYDTLVPYIINRKGDGICPFELAVRDITEPHRALEAIHGKMEEMGIILT